LLNFTNLKGNAAPLIELLNLLHKVQVLIFQISQKIFKLLNLKFLLEWVNLLQLNLILQILQLFFTLGYTQIIIS